MAFVTGKSVTPEQAKDILFRTDSNFHMPSPYGFGNNHRFKEYCFKIFGWQKLFDEQDSWYRLTDGQRQEKLAAGKSVSDTYGVLEDWCKEMGIVKTQYVNNSWLSSAYIGGPHGWCSPEGDIFSDGHNYGKWPSVEEIENDWIELAKAFPYIDLACTMFSGEQCEENIVPVVTMLVKNGTVAVYEADLSVHHKQPTFGGEDRIETMLQRLLSGSTSEQGWPMPWVLEFGEKSTAAMKKIAPQFV
jgi:hypothetical protein